MSKSTKEWITKGDGRLSFVVKIQAEDMKTNFWGYFNLDFYMEQWVGPYCLHGSFVLWSCNYIAVKKPQRIYFVWNC